jgi:hypothetical protein
MRAPLQTRSGPRGWCYPQDSQGGKVVWAVKSDGLVRPDGSIMLLPGMDVTTLFPETTEGHPDGSSRAVA